MTKNKSQPCGVIKNKCAACNHQCLSTCYDKGAIKSIENVFEKFIVQYTVFNKRMAMDFSNGEIAAREAADIASYEGVTDLKIIREYTSINKYKINTGPYEIKNA